MIRPVRLALLAVASTLVGCGGPALFLVPDAGPRPRILAVHLQPVVVHNQDDLKDDLGFDEAHLRQWMKPLLAQQLSASMGIDSIVWKDDLATKPDTVPLGKYRVSMPLPADSAQTGWVLILYSPDFYRRAEMTGQIGDHSPVKEKSLFVRSIYRLRDFSGKRDLAYGWADGSSFYNAYMDESDWRKATLDLGASLGQLLPAKVHGK